MREFAFVRQHIPSRVEKRSKVEGRRSRAGTVLPSTLDARLSTRREPRLQVLLKTFLRLEVVGHDDNRAARENFPEQSRKKRLRCLADTRASQHSAILQSSRKGLHSGSFRDVSEQAACRRRCRVLRQAQGHSQREAGSSSRRRLRNHGLFVSEFRVETGWLESFQPLAMNRFKCS